MNNKNGLDEMQKERRNHIGNQMFMLMFYALFLNGGLYYYGIRWLDYPSNVMIISVICMGIYLVRVIAASAYLPPKAQNRKAPVTIIMVIVFAIALIISAISLFGQVPAQVTEAVEDNSALILFIASAVGLVAMLITALTRRANNKNDADD